MRKLQLINVTTYCHKAKVWDTHDMIIEYVQKEDIINHPYQRQEIPKLTYPVSNLEESVGLWNFFKKEVNAVLP